MPARWLALLLLLLGLPGFAVPPTPPPVPADGSSSLRVLYPAGRVFEYDGLFPLVLEFNNSGLTQRTYRFSWGSSLEVPKELKRLQLEPGEKRRFPLVFPRNEVGNLYNLEVNKKSHSHELVGSPRNLVTGILAPKEEGFDYLRALKLEVDPNQSSNDPNEPTKYVPLSSISRMDAEVAPESWTLLTSLDSIIVYDLPALSLSTTQIEALIQWAEKGGTLVLVSNGVPEEYAGTPLQKKLPFQASGVDSQDGFIALEGRRAEGCSSTYEHKGVPLVYKRPVLQGQIVQVTAPLTELGPLDEEASLKLWRTIYDNIPDNTTNHYRNRSRVAANTLNDIPEHPRAQAGLLAGFLLLYALIVGPLNLGILRRKDKMLWAFVSVPMIALVFAAGAYLINVAGRSSTPVLRELGLLEIKAGATRGVAESHTILYSPSAQRYTLTTAPESGFEYIDYQREGFGLYQINPDGGLSADIELGTWDILSFLTESLLELEKPFDLKVTYQDLAAKTELAGGAKLSVNSPYPSLGEALLYDPVRGISDPFELQAGQQSIDLKFQGAPGYDKFSAIAASDKKTHPGHAALLQSLSNESSRFQSGFSYLIFWTDQLQTPLEANNDATHAAEFLVVVEFER